MPDSTAPESTAPSAPVAQNAPVSATDSKTNAILAWIFAPITSFIWKDSPDDFLKQHARESLNFGIATILGFIVLSVLNFLYTIVIGNFLYSSFTLFSVGTALSCVWSVLWLVFWAFTVVPRIVGAVKASNNQTWTVPYVSKFMGRFMKW